MHQKTNANISDIRKLESRKTNSVAQDQRENRGYQTLLFSCQVMSNSFATPWTIARQASLSLGFPRQEYWNGLPFLFQGVFLFPRDLPDSEVEPVSLVWQAGSLLLSHLGSLWIKETIGKTRCRFSLQLSHGSATATPFFKLLLKNIIEITHDSFLVLFLYLCRVLFIEALKNCKRLFAQVK